MRNRIKELREGRGLTLEQLAELADMSAGYVSRLENSKRNINSKSLQKIAHALGVANHSLISEATPIPVCGYVGLGEEIEWSDESDTPIEEIEMPGVPLADGIFAVIGRGNSMAPRVFDGDAIVIRRDGRPPLDLIGRECVVKVLNGPHLFKRLRRGYEPARFNLESYNASLRENVELEWAAELVTIIPAGQWRQAMR